MKVSIALATYNGEKYLIEQLGSLVHQSMLPYELVVSDDCSTDRTIDVLQNFAQSAPFPVKIHKNSFNKGYSKNFENAINHCSGDLIFICDQDDLWLPIKIETMVDFMKCRPKLILAVNNCELVDNNLRRSGIAKIDQIHQYFGNIDKYVPGCCTVFRKSFKNLFLPIIHEYDYYDGWLHYIAKSLKMRGVCRNVLQYYRIHENNTSEFPPNTIIKPRYFKRLLFKIRFLVNSKNKKIISLKNEYNINIEILERIEKMQKENSGLYVDKSDIILYTELLLKRFNYLSKNYVPRFIKLLILYIFNSNYKLRMYILDVLTIKK